MTNRVVLEDEVILRSVNGPEVTVIEGQPRPEVVTAMGHPLCLPGGECRPERV